MQDDAETLPAATPDGAMPDGDLDDAAEWDAGVDDDLTGDWLSGLDEDSAEFVRTKGWEDLDAVVRSYQNLESMLGSDRAGRTLTVPKDEDDAEAYAEIYDRLGRPEAAADYALEVPDGMAIDEPMMDWYREAAHAAGLSARQASALFDAWNGMAVQRVVAMNQDKQAAQDQDIEALREKWGGAFDRKVAAARQAARRFGGEQSAALEDALGRAGVTEFLAGIGEAVSEDALPAGEGRTGFGLSPDEARANYEQRKRDPGFVAALQDAAHPGHAAASAERARYLAAIWPAQ